MILRVIFQLLCDLYEFNVENENENDKLENELNNILRQYGM